MISFGSRSNIGNKIILDMDLNLFNKITSSSNSLIIGSPDYRYR